MLNNEPSTKNKASARIRRRKPIPAGSDVEKENRNANSNPRRGVAETPSTNSVENEVGGFDRDYISFGNLLDDSPAYPSSSSVDDTLCSQASHMFKKAQTRVTVSVNLLKEHPDLVNVLISASLFRTTSGSLFLDEHSSSLLSLARKLIKDATNSSVKDERQCEQLDNLFVAVHILRAISFVLANISNERRESLLKLFYHLITTVSDADRVLKSASVSISVRAGLIALAGYEGLGHVLTKYSTQTNVDGDQSMTYFELVHDSERVTQVLFAVPVSSTKTRRKEKDSTASTMSGHQLATIALKTTAATASAIKRFTNTSINKELRSLHPSCYGSLGFIVSDDKVELYTVLIDMLKRVNEPWLIFLAKTTAAEQDVEKEVVSYAKGTHRLLWDAASELQSESNAANRSLELRKIAIELLLPKTSVGYVDRMIRSSLFDVACTYAWKAATVYFQSSSKGSASNAGHAGLLSSFYVDMDSTFERILLDGIIPLGYVEYIAYKSLHTCLPQGALVSSKFVNGGEDRGHTTLLDGDYGALMRVLVLGIYVRGTLQFHNAGESETLAQLKGRLLNRTEQVAREFNIQITQQLSVLPTEIRNRIFKILSSLSLQKTLFIALKEPSEAFSSMEETILLGTKILTDCLGPFAVSFSKFCSEKSDQVYDLIVECFIRPIAVFEQLAKLNTFHSAPYSTLSDAACRKLYDIVSIENLPIQCIEKAAKSLSLTARQRNASASPEESILPMLYSVKLYEKLSTTYCDEGHEYQLSSRLILFSNALAVAGKLNQSFHVSCIALRIESGGCRFVGSEVQLLDFLVSKCSGAILPRRPGHRINFPDLTKGTCLRMAGQLCHIKEFAPMGYNPSNPVDPTFGMGLDVVVEGIDGHPLLSIMAAFRELNLVPSTSRTACQIDYVCFIVEVMVLFGQSALTPCGEQKTDQQSYEVAFRNFHLLIGLLCHMIDELDVKHPQVFNAILILAAYTAVAPAWNILDKDSQRLRIATMNPLFIGFATTILKGSIDLLEPSVTSGCQPDFAVLSETIRIALRRALFELTFLAEGNKLHEASELVDDIISVAESLVNVRDAEDSDKLFTWAKYSTVWTMTDLQNRLQSSGDHVNAAILSFWTLALMSQEDSSGASWFAASVCTECLNDSSLIRLSHPSNGLLITSSKAVPHPGTSDWLFETEYLLCQMRIETLQGGMEGEEFLKSKIQSLQAIRMEAEQYHIEGDERLLILHLWLLSTIYLVELDTNIACGSYIDALDSSQSCLRYCQAIMKCAYSRSASVEMWIPELAVSTILVRAAQRYTSVLSRRPKLYYRIGDHRKAAAYMRSALDLFTSNSESSRSMGNPCTQLNDLITILTVAPFQFKTQIRLFLEVKSWGSTHEKTVEEFAQFSPQCLVQRERHVDGGDSEAFVECVRDLVAAGDVLYGDSISTLVEKSFPPYYYEATENLERNIHLFQLSSAKLPTSFELRLTTPLKKQLQLRNARQLLESSSELDDEECVVARKLCESVEECEDSYPEDKAWALYYLGHLELQEARSTGALQALWSDGGSHTYELNVSNRSLHEARDHLARAILWAMNVSDVLHRNILRSLALALGPTESKGIGTSAGILILASIGQSTRRRMILSSHRSASDGDTSRKLRSPFGTFDGPYRPDVDRDRRISSFLRRLAQLTPDNWTFAASTICPSGEILFASLQKASPNAEFAMSTKCVFPPNHSNGYDAIMKPFDSIMMRVQEQLHAIEHSETDDKESMKRNWWHERSRLDDELSGLLGTVDETFFFNLFATSDDDAATAVSSDHSKSSSSDDSRGFPRGNLASKFDAAIDKVIVNLDTEHHDRAKTLTQMTVAKLKAMLRELDVADSKLRKLRKTDLVDLLIRQEERNTRCSQETTESKRDPHDGAESCLFLVLDENLQRFPFEGMPSLRSKTVCRVPCLSFVLATLCEHITDPPGTPSIDPNSVAYILDPENNLHATKRRLLPVIERLNAKQNRHWNGVVGEIPPPSFFSKALADRLGLVMYFGHGGAQLCFSRRDVEEMIVGRFSNSPDGNSIEPSCRSTVVLMGCSSGRLVSINKKNASSIEQVPLYYEPEGIALSYLCAGAPCVIGNLWDVTDHDIDRFSVSLLENFFHLANGNAPPFTLADCVSMSRSACKLRYVVGCAPVCYGVPVHLIARNTNQRV